MRKCAILIIIILLFVCGRIEINHVTLRRTIASSIAPIDVPIMPIKGPIVEYIRRYKGTWTQIIWPSHEFHKPRIVTVVQFSFPFLDGGPTPLIDGIVYPHHGWNGTFIDPLPSLTTHGIVKLLLTGIHPMLLIGSSSSSSSRRWLMMWRTFIIRLATRNGRYRSLSGQGNGLIQQGRLGMVRRFFHGWRQSKWRLSVLVLKRRRRRRSVMLDWT